jgi:hypothetical protein
VLNHLPELVPVRLLRHDCGAERLTGRTEGRATSWWGQHEARCSWRALWCSG